MTLKVKALMCAGLLTAAAVGRAADPENDRDRGSLADFPEGAHGGTHAKGNASHGAKSGPSNVINHNGGVLAASNFYFVWWGSWPSTPNPTHTLLLNFVANLGNRSVDLFNMMDQYLGVPGLMSHLGPDVTDVTAPPSRGPSTSTIVGEVCKATNNNPDPNGIYAVMASNFPKGANYCAWHSWGSCSGGAPVQVIYQPNPKGVTGCDAGVSPNNNQQADSTANVLSHEIFETITDPRGTGWYDRSGEEIADKCAWTFSVVPGTHYTNTVGGFSYYIQQEWSNAFSGCVQLAK